MHTPRPILLSSAIILIVCLSVGQTTAQEEGPGVEPAAESTAFTYQGQLKDSGGKPISDNCDFQFGLWDALSAGYQVAGTVTQTVPAIVTDGLFTVQVDFGAGAFDGNSRWLAVAVKCDGEKNYTALDPRQALTPAPYALTAARLPWGASWSGSGQGTGLSLSGGAIGLYGSGLLYGVQGHTAAASGIGVYGTAPITGVAGLATAADGIGVYGRSNASSGYGLYGYAPIGTGVYGQSSSGYGVYGHATAATGSTRGVYGWSDSSSGYGVYGRGSYGVYGYSSSTSGYGVYGFATASTGGNYGVYGDSSSNSGYGLYGSSEGTGVYGTAPTTGTVGIATAASGQTIGVYGQTDSTSGYGVYGYATTLSGYSYGVSGRCDSSLGYGVSGLSSNGTGVYGGSTSGKGVKGQSWAQAGVYGYSDTSNGVEGHGANGVYGETSSYTGQGGYFKNTTDGGVGLKAESTLGPIMEGYSDSGRVFYVSYDGAFFAKGYYTPGSDYAEMLPAQEALQPGDLLAIGPDGKLVKTTSAYQSSVAGVYSTRPGVVGGASDGQDTTGKVPLAVMGVAPVKVSAENGAIQPGDLLTASDTPGYAMKARPITVNGVTFYPSGVVIGKALGGLADGTGLISVLVTLQ